MGVAWGPELYNSTDRETVREAVQAELNDIADELELSANSSEGRIHALAGDMRRGSFWHIFGMIDGPQIRPGTHDVATKKLRNKADDARQWAHYRLGPERVDRLGTLAAFYALNPLPRATRPGHYHGHNILFDRAFGMPESTFHQGETEESDVLRKRLNNGRFYESLSGLSPGLDRGIWYCVARDVLINHAEDLDVAFVPEGLALTAADGGMHRSRFDYLGPQALEAYHHYLSDVHWFMDSHGVTWDQFRTLATPYLPAITARGNDEELVMPWSTGNWLQDTWVHKLLDEDPVLMKHVTSCVVHEMNHGNPRAAGAWATDLARNQTALEQILDKVSGEDLVRWSHLDREQREFVEHVA